MPLWSEHDLGRWCPLWWLDAFRDGAAALSFSEPNGGRCVSCLQRLRRTVPQRSREMIYKNISKNVQIFIDVFPIVSRIRAFLFGDCCRRWLILGLPCPVPQVFALTPTRSSTSRVPWRWKPMVLWNAWNAQEWQVWTQVLCCNRNNRKVLPLILRIASWWFGTFFIFPYIGNNHPNWLIFFRGVQTTNQIVNYFLLGDCCSYTPEKRWRCHGDAVGKISPRPCGVL